MNAENTLKKREIGGEEKGVIFNVETAVAFFLQVSDFAQYCNTEESNFAEISAAVQILPQISIWF